VPVPFSKFHGLGNDFIVLDLVAAPEGAHLASPEAARRLCDRHFGIGADGLLVLHPAPPASPGEAIARRLVILNADGSEPEMCGNGVRCVAKYLHDLPPAGTGPEVVDLATAAGLRRCRVHRGPDGLAAEITVEMGPVTLGAPDELLDAPWPGRDTAAGPALVAAGLTDARWSCTRVSVGNPHSVFFLERPTAELCREIGPVLERHPRFAPRGANIELVALGADGALDVQVWERGAGATLACGTGACAAAAAACATGRARWGDELRVRLPGGPLRIRIDPGSLQASMRGPADRVFSGVLP
jgi:diaminopimelate epimerase